MNVVGKISLGLTAALALNLGARVAVAAPLIPPPALPPAADSALATAPAIDSSQPYATIVARNIFGLVPVPPPPADTGPPPDPPPKITANGIMSVFGELQALFKVSLPGKGGQPPKDQSYMLSEGQRQDDIEVVKIDVKAATITFDNHGTHQEIPLETSKDSGPSGGFAVPAAGGPPPGGGGFNPAVPRFHPRPGMPLGGLPSGGAPSGGVPSGFPGGGNPGNPVNAAGAGGGQDNNANPLSALGGGAPIEAAQQQSAAAIAAQNADDLTTEQRILLIEAERARLESSQNPEYPPNLLPGGPGASGGGVPGPR